MSTFYLEKDGPKRDQVKGERELREQVSSMVGHTGFAGKINPMTANIEVVKTLATPILKEFQETAAKRGALIAEEFVDSMGRNCRRFHGDARVGLEGFAAGGARCKVAPLTTINGKTYLSDRLPPAARRMAVLNKAGFSE